MPIVGNTHQALYPIQTRARQRQVARLQIDRGGALCDRHEQPIGVRGIAERTDPLAAVLHRPPRLRKTARTEVAGGNPMQPIDGIARGLGRRRDLHECRRCLLQPVRLQIQFAELDLGVFVVRLQLEGAPQ